MHNIQGMSLRDYPFMCFQAKRTGYVDLGVRRVTLVLNKNL